MKLSKIAKMLGKNISDADGEADIIGFYCGDHLSRVMVRAPEGCGWLTVINNINVAGVAVFAKIPLVILCEGVTAGEQLRTRLEREGIALLETPLTVFECCKKLADIG